VQKLTSVLGKDHPEVLNRNEALEAAKLPKASVPLDEAQLGSKFNKNLHMSNKGLHHMGKA
jgi:hypothetical protein